MNLIELIIFYFFVAVVCINLLLLMYRLLAELGVLKICVPKGDGTYHWIYYYEFRKDKRLEEFMEFMKYYDSRK